MRQHINCNNKKDEQGNPTGGTVDATGITIRWQDGPLNRGEKRIEPNGAFVEGVITAAKQRIEYFQENGKFACRENALAITRLDEALHWLNHRTADREARGVEGTHTA